MEWKLTKNNTEDAKCSFSAVTVKLLVVSSICLSSKIQHLDSSIDSMSHLLPKLNTIQTSSLLLFK